MALFSLNSIWFPMIGWSGTILCHLSSSCLRMSRSLSVFPILVASSRIGASLAVVGTDIHVDSTSHPNHHYLYFHSLDTHSGTTFIGLFPSRRYISPPTAVVDKSFPSHRPYGFLPQLQLAIEIIRIIHFNLEKKIFIA